MAQLLLLTATGPADPTRASIPFHIGANGAGAANRDYAVILAGDATELAKPDVVAGVRGVGVPPLAELLEKLRAQGAPVYV